MVYADFTEMLNIVSSTPICQLCLNGFLHPEKCINLAYCISININTRNLWSRERIITQ